MVKRKLFGYTIFRQTVQKNSRFTCTEKLSNHKLTYIHKLFYLTSQLAIVAPDWLLDVLPVVCWSLCPTF